MNMMISNKSILFGVWTWMGRSTTLLFVISFNCRRQLAGIGDKIIQLRDIYVTACCIGKWKITHWSAFADSSNPFGTSAHWKSQYAAVSMFNKLANVRAQRNTFEMGEFVQKWHRCSLRHPVKCSSEREQTYIRNTPYPPIHLSDPPTAYIFYSPFWLWDPKEFVSAESSHYARSNIRGFAAIPCRTII